MLNYNALIKVVFENFMDASTGSLSRAYKRIYVPNNT